MDFAQHNGEQGAVWAAYRAGEPVRVPVSIACNPRMILLDPVLNTNGYTFQDCFEDPAAMFEVDLQFQYWYRHYVPCDIPRGIPERWEVAINFQNSWEAPWYGASLHFMAGEVPDTRPILTDDNKRMLFDRGIPDPFGGILGTARGHYEAYGELAAKTIFHDRPVSVLPCSPGLGSDGPVTLACELRGATEFCLDLYEDPDYAQELMAFLVEATLTRQRAWREYLGLPLVRESVWFADDSIALLSVEMYREMVLPHHRRLTTTDAVPGAPVSVHLCGDATRHFPLLVRELGVRSFDTGFPVDHGQLRKELGPEIEILGGPQVSLLLNGTPEEVAAETARILHSGVMDGKFVLKEANNLAPRTPMRNLQAMYETCRREGVYRSDCKL